MTTSDRYLDEMEYDFRLALTKRLDLVLRIRNTKNFFAGAMFIVFGIAFLAPALTYPIGDLNRMGPGLWPLALSVLLILLGAITAGRAFAGDEGRIGVIAVRPVIFMSLASIFFAAAVKPLGLAATVFVSVLIASLSVPKYNKRTALIVAVVLSIGTVLVFIKGLGVSLQAFGPWLAF